jgi:hypothetical protein
MNIGIIIIIIIIIAIIIIITSIVKGSPHASRSLPGNLTF